MAVVPGHSVLVAPGTVCVAPEGGAGSDVAPANGAPGNVIRFELVGADRSARAVPEQTLLPVSHYLIGSDPADWRRGVAHHAVLRYPGVLQGVDVVHHIVDGQVRTDYVLAPGTRVDGLRIRVKGGDSVRLDEANGDIVVTAAGGEFRYSAPVTFQRGDGADVPVESRFVRRGSRTFAVRVGAHDRGRALVVDPTIEYSSYLGPSAAIGPFAASFATDDDGALYLQIRNAPAAGFPATPGAYESTTTCSTVQAVRKYDPTGLQVPWTTYIGSQPASFANCGWMYEGIAVDGQGATWCVGAAQSGQPEVNPLLPSPPSGEAHAYIARLSSSGDALLFASYLGDATLGFVRVSEADEVYLAGFAGPDYQPLVNPASLDPAPRAPEFNSFVMKLAAGGSSVLFSTYVFADGPVLELDIDGQGRMLLVSRAAPTLPVVNAPVGWDAPFLDVIWPATLHVARLAADAQSLDFAYFLPMASEFEGAAVLADGSFVFAGPPTEGFPNLNPPVWSLDHPAPFPQVSPHLGFIGMDSSGQPTWSALLGGSGGETLYAFEAASTGRLTFAGSTTSTDLPVVNAFQPAYAGGLTDGFAGQISPDGRALDWYSYIGGGVPATTWRDARDARDLVFRVTDSPATGATWLLTLVGSQDFPVTPDALVGVHPFANMPDPGFPWPVPLSFAITRLSSTSTPRVREPSALDLRPNVRPLTLGSGAAGRLILGWEETTGGTSFNLNIGRLISLRRDRAYDHAPLDPAWCRLPVASADIPMPTEDSYFLITAVKDTAGGYEESSYGRDSSGVERPAVNPAAACP